MIVIEYGGYTWTAEKILFSENFVLLDKPKKYDPNNKKYDDCSFEQMLLPWPKVTRVLSFDEKIFEIQGEQQ